MKIKHLSIRNIASIEKGDIDFENGLTDPFSDSPASLFLITGDTGAGKSVILDCISMCLYGTTPRVEGVNGVKKNRFSTSDGSELSVTDIEQYTRLGITAKDDCFARLTFEGNDGVIYEATFELGMTTHRNFASPKWTLKVGNETVLEKKKNVAPVIRQAVGLSYEQFSRMAMLAQGQFASFLTGGKEERERILEQLTSTEHFSRYGAAIDRIFKRNKKEKELLENSLAAEKAHILREEEEAELRRQRSAQESILDNSRKNLENINEHLRLDSELKRISAEILRDETALREIEQRRATEDFKNRKQLLAVWDEMSAPRAALLRKLDSQKTLDRYSVDLRKATEKFGLYLHLLDERRSGAEADRKVLVELEEKLKSKEGLREIAESVGLHKERLARFAGLCTDLQCGRKEAAAERLALTASAAELRKTADKLAARRKDVADIQKQLDEKQALLTELVGPEGLKGLRSTLSVLSDDRTALESLTREIQAFDEENDSSKQLTADVEQLGKFIKERRTHLAKLKTALDKATEESRKADERYSTMHLSVEEGFCELRRQLRDEHASTCPLCGQSIDDPEHWAGDEEMYSAILSPLLTEKQQKAACLETAQKEYDSLNSAINTDNGRLKALSAQYKALSERIAKASGRILDRLKKCGLSASDKVMSADASGDVSGKSSINASLTDTEVASEITDVITLEMRRKISARIEDTSAKIDSLTATIAKADAVSEEIAAIGRRKTQADAAKEESLKAFHKVESLCENRRQRISGCYEKIFGYIASMRQLRKDLTLIADGFDPQWSRHPEFTAEKLAEEADAYLSLKRDVQQRRENLDRLEELLTAIAVQSENISAILPSELMPELVPELMPHRLIQKYSQEAREMRRMTDIEFRNGWTELYAEIKGLVKDIDETRTAIAGYEATLKDFYEENGLDEAYLTGLLKCESEIPAIRKSVEDLERELNIVARHLESAKAELLAVKEGLKSLPPIESELTDDQSQPDLPQMKTALEKEIEERLKTLGSINSRLDTNDQLRKDFESLLTKVEKQREAYYKWEKIYRYFGGNRFRTLVQSYILKPLLRNANLYLERITDHYTLTCSDENEQLAILVLDRYNKNQIRSATVLSGGERFMISLALSLALSALNKADMNVDILFIDEGFGTLDAGSLNAVIDTLRRLPEIAGQNGRRVGVISHREELADEIDVKIEVVKCGEGRSRIQIH